MLVIENKCPECYGHLVLDEETRTVKCEDCDTQSKPEQLNAVYKLLTHFYPSIGMSKRKVWASIKSFAVEYGPPEKRQFPTEAGKYLLKAFEMDNAGAMMCENITYLRSAVRGALEDEDKIAELVRGGYILGE